MPASPVRAGLLGLAALAVAAVHRPAPALEVALGLHDPSGARLVEAPAGGAVRLVLEARDPLTGWPAARPPRAWLARLRAADEPCASAAARLLQRGADPWRERALEGYRLVLFGPEGELALLDPRLRLASARLQGATRLPATPIATVLDERRAILWAALPAGGLARLELAAPSRAESPASAGLLLPDVRATALVLLADGHLALAGTDSRLRILDPEGRETASLALSTAVDALAFDPLTGRIWAGGPGGLAMIERDPRGLGAEPILAEAVDALLVLPRKRLVLAQGGGSLWSLDADEASLLARTALPGRVGTLAVDRDEALVLALDRAAGIVSLLDPTSDRPIGALTMEDGIEEMGLSARQAYLAAGSTARIALLPLAGVEPGRLPPLAPLAMGSVPRGPAGPLPRLAATPDGRSMLILAPGERRVFLHGEGAMLAPSSALPVPFPDARGILVQPLGFAPAGPGRFELVTMLPASVRELVLVFDDPPEAHCLALPVAAAAAVDPDLDRGPRLRLLPGEDPPIAGRRTRFAVEVEPVGASVPAPDYLALSTANGWFVRGRASPAGEGRFEVELVFPEAGRYELLARLPELGLDFAQGASLAVQVEAPR